MLRPYQQDALAACIAAHHKDYGGCVICPTGSGKSHIIAELCQHFEDKDVLVLTPRIELMKQNAAKIKSNAKCMTVNKAYRQLRKSEILIIDECHLIRQFDGMYHTLMSLSERVFGFTATPFRLDCGHLVPHVFKKALYKISREELVEQGYLTERKKHLIGPNHLINVRNESYQSVRKLSEDSCPQTAHSLEHFLAHAPSNKQALFYACDLKHADVICRLLGGKAKTIHSKLSKSERATIISEFKSGQLQYLVNCEILTLGFDYPPLEHVVILRPTDSFTLYEQICGRGDRIYENKRWNNIWDYTINSFCFESKPNKPGDYKRHCIHCLKITDYRLKNCTSCGKGLVRGEAPTKECPECHEPNFTCATYCKECGAFIKANVRWIKTNKVGWNNKGWLEIGGVKFKTAKGNAQAMISKIKGQSYIFFYKWDSYNKSNKLLEIRLDK